MESHYQTVINIYSAKFLDSISQFLGKIPFFVFPLFFFALLFAIIKLARGRKLENDNEKKLIKNK